MTRHRRPLTVTAITLAALAVVEALISAKLPSMMASSGLSMLDAAMQGMQIGLGIAAILALGAIATAIVALKR